MILLLNKINSNGYFGFMPFSIKEKQICTKLEELGYISYDDRQYYTNGLNIGTVA